MFMAEKHNLYPHFEVENNKTPDMLYAFPLLGFILKLIMVIPIIIEFCFLSIAFMFLWTVNLFVVLFTGKYWDTAYHFFVGYLRLSTKFNLFLFGLTDKYPGFALNTDGLFTLDIEKPTHPNRWLSIPFFGPLTRLVLLIPYIIFQSVLNQGSVVAMVISWFAVVFKKKYPESLYEFVRDNLRVSNAASAYMLGLKDVYPSFDMSMNHQTVKILLIIAGALLLFR